MSSESSIGKGFSEKGFRPQEMAFSPYAYMAEHETPKDHGMIMAGLDLYLDLVPVGIGGQNREPISPELRVKLFEEREHCCEACRRDLSGQRFEAHHTDYTKGNNPDYLKLLCNSCHNIVNVLTGLKWWFAKEAGLVPKKKETDSDQLPPRPQKSHFDSLWDDPPRKIHTDVDEE